MSRPNKRYSTLLLTSLTFLLYGCGQHTPQDLHIQPQATLLLHQEAESMTLAGGCTGVQATRVVYYCNNDATYNTHNFTQSGRFSIKVRGASTANNTASIAVLVGSTKVATLNFTGTTFTDQSALFDLSTTGSREIRLKLETDSGANDTLVDWYELSYEGATPPPPPAPVPPSTGAYASGQYRNLFREWNPALTDADVQNKLNTYWQSLFASTDDNTRVYYPMGSNANGALAYILDTGNGDVRSEGVSYGMMIAVQMNKKAEFDALWNFAKTHMQHQTGARKGYFAWQVSTSGSKMDNNPASDGEEYFATALFFAGHRWGNGTGIYNYTAEANDILNTMLHKEDINGGVVDSVTNMFNKTHKQVVFVPFANAATFSDPSYHLPAFYELWGRWATGYQGQTAADRQFWLDAAQTSRQFFLKSTHSTTALNPDYAEFSGAPNNTGNHGDFRFDAWRTAMNWGMDYAWWAADANQKTLSNKLLAFFDSQGVTSYVNQYSLSGTPLSTDRSPGLIATNGAAALSATDVRAWKFVEEMWKLQPPTGRYRYYDGLVSYLALLNASGNFKIYKPGNTDTPVTTTPTAPSGLTAAASSSSQINLTWADNSSNESSFLIERKTGTTGTYTQVATVAANTTSYQNTGLIAGTTYVYRVRASNSVGNSTYTTESSATTTAAPTTAPTAPEGLTAAASSSSQINLTWTDNSNNESSFLIERKTGTSGTYTQVATVAANTTSYQNTGLTAGTTYVYRVRASNSVGNSAYTTESSATTTGAASSNPFTQLEAELWNTQANTSNAAADGGTVVNFSGPGSYVVFNNLNFGAGAGSVQFRASTSTAGVNLQVRVGSLSASPACTVYPDGNGSWHLKSNSCWPKITGTQTIYITTTGPVKVNWLKFSQ